MTNPATADPYLADVFALGKTLWVLATGQRWPMQGHQRADRLENSIGTFRAGAQVRGLDAIVDQCTSPATERPSMADVVKELRAWIRMAEHRPGEDAGEDQELLDQLRQRLSGRLSAEQQRARQLEQAQAAFTKATTGMFPSLDVLRTIDPSANPDAFDAYTQEMLVRPDSFGSALRVHWGTWTFRVAGEGYLPVALRLGVAWTLDEEGVVTVSAMWDVHQEQAMAGGHFASFEATGPAGSVELDEAIDRLVGDVVRGREAALRAFNAAL